MKSNLCGDWLFILKCAYHLAYDPENANPCNPFPRDRLEAEAQKRIRSGKVPHTGNAVRALAELGLLATAGHGMIKLTPDGLREALVYVKACEDSWRERCGFSQRARDMASAMASARLATIPEIAKTANKPQLQKRNKQWTAKGASDAIRQYLAKHSKRYSLLCEAIGKASGAKRAKIIKQAQAIFGRNALSRILDIPCGTVSNTMPFKAIRAELHLEQSKTPAMPRNRRGLQIVEEEAGTKKWKADEADKWLESQNADNRS